jgi:hypothetical protein
MRGPAVTGDPDDLALDAGIQIAAAAVLGEEGSVSKLTAWTYLPFGPRAYISTASCASSAVRPARPARTREMNGSARSATYGTP